MFDLWFYPIFCIMLSYIRNIYKYYIPISLMYHIRPCFHPLSFIFDPWQSFFCSLTFFSFLASVLENAGREIVWFDSLL